MKRLASALICAALITGCSGIRTTDSTFAVHAESFRIIGMPIPGDDQQAARELVPAGAQVVTLTSSAADWTSFWGGLGNLFWFHQTNITGTLKR